MTTMPASQTLHDDVATPDTRRKRLGGNSRSGTTVYGWPAILFGLPFIGIGVLILLRAANVITSGDIHAPNWVLGTIGTVFAVVGLLFAFSGGKDVLRQLRLRRWTLQHPQEPWMADHRWDITGSSDELGKNIVRTFFFAAFLALFLVPFNYIGLVKGDLVFGFVSLAFDAAILAMLGYGFYLLARRIKYGRTRIRFAQFPLFLNDVAEVSFVPGRGWSAYDRITFTLRCVEEVIETSGHGKNRRTTISRYQVYADVFEVSGPGRFDATDAALPVTFLLPHDGPCTRLAQSPPTYWELEVKAATPGIDFCATYLLPVYTRPS